ncbi:formylglycine-generating enzyme family protein [Wenzhouxiangella sp. XN79A]|uniref:formylglycine-generating enzyme family protein n=1 Tax=Wenzhouxiangella sp. XN79A TaxID=2724193 RepID=UPI00144AA510|nr:formylglycine-generating enzyme family protein [Wenzhouxiangella sp. XN79A]NKI36332.1 formylglycine-generating enzyme family protein [Wenzhouxiangella sp. XN79A]
MTPLEYYVADWLQREGRVPDDALTRLPPEVGAEVERRAELESVAERLAAERPELAAKRRIVLGIQARIQARGGQLSTSEREDLIRRAQPTGWGAHDVDRLIEAALQRIQAPPRNADAPNDEPAAAATAGAASPARSIAAGIRAPALVTVFGVVSALGMVVLAGGYWLLRDDAPGPASASAGPGGGEPMPAAQVRTAQQLLGRLGHPVPESGRFDAATRAALDRALPQYAGLQELRPWLVDQLQTALDERDDAAWTAARETGTVAAVTDYLERYPEGRNVDAARERMVSLGAAEQRADLVRALQQELNRLGRRVAETGELDPATRAAMVGFPGPMPGQTRASLGAALEALRELRRWPVPDGGSFRDCSTCPDMVAIPAGRFVMGSPPDERMRSPTEGPQREVDVARFALSRTEVTHGEWLACVNDGVCPSLPIPEQGDLRRLPVTHVGMTDALFYFRWLRDRTGFDYRLPTEAEWEYAARAGTTTRYATGECITSDQANFDARLTSGDCPRGDYRGAVLPVASFAPNAFGLYDMHGNLLEPVRDCWNSDYQGAPDDGSAWEAGDCGRSPLRGGSWNSSDRDLRSAARIRPSPIERNPENGLRVAVSLEPGPAAP